MRPQKCVQRDIRSRKRGRHEHAPGVHALRYAQKKIAGVGAFSGGGF
jgi:hypothetical protein